jgi:hypothetical protein
LPAPDYAACRAARASHSGRPRQHGCKDEKIMHTEDALRFAQERLRHHGLPLGRALGFEQAPRVLRRFAVELGKGETQVFERVDSSVLVRCATGSIWITHDGDCKDVILLAGEGYRADREEAMHLFALADCVLELEFEDEPLSA